MKGAKKGQSEVFIDGLPGFPDNIHSDKKGGFHVTLPMDIDKDNIGLSAVLGPYPLVRRFIARMLFILELPAHQINLYYPNYYTKVYTHWVSCFLQKVICSLFTVYFLKYLVYDEEYVSINYLCFIPTFQSGRISYE